MKETVLSLNPSALVQAGVAQLVEHQPSKLRVASSSLVSRSKLLPEAVSRETDGGAGSVSARVAQG